MVKLFELRCEINRQKWTTQGPICFLELHCKLALSFQTAYLTKQDIAILFRIFKINP